MTLSSNEGQGWEGIAGLVPGVPSVSCEVPGTFQGPPGFQKAPLQIVGSLGEQAEMVLEEEAA